jgi:nuclear transport factor 2 (NTF2) superfamily protein
MNPRSPLPPFTEETARQKVQAAEDAWNSRDPDRVSTALRFGSSPFQCKVLTSRTTYIWSFRKILGRRVLNVS